MFARIALALLPLLGGCATAPPVVPPTLIDTAPAPSAWGQSCKDFDEWDKPGPPFRVFGDTYYVGTCGITSLLLTGAQGHTLVDSGTDEGAKTVLANIRALGFDPRDVKAILLSHEHFDHVGGMARIQAATGATIYASPAAAAVLRSGIPGRDDPQAQSGHPPFPPVTGRIVEITSPQVLKVGSHAVSPIATPGHTPGALSWTWQECASGRCADIVYVDSMNPISSDGYRFSDFPDLVAAFSKGIDAVAAAPCDIVLAPHPGAVDLRARVLGTKPLLDPDGCARYAAGVRQRLDDRLAKEAHGG